MDLNNRVVLLTGARRIGAVVAAAVATRGADVAIAYNRSAAEATEAAARIQALGRKALVVQADVSDPASCEALIANVERSFGRLDVLVNMASFYQAVIFDELDVEKWDHQLAIDLRGAFLCAKAAVPVMRKVGGGRIINFSDWVAASNRPRYKGYVAYYVAKAGVKALTEALALELAIDGILVNAIAPGPILAPPDTTDAASQAVEQATPLGRWGGPEEIVKAVLALIDSDFITGETIRVDGGRHVY
jgi:NAD(P)-dependent dehydrogenase (short-subunit alcohol dehydrogenase family)